MPVTTSTSEETLLITIDRPPVNALDLDMIIALEQAFAAAARDQRRAMVLAITRMVAQLLSIPSPVVAAINGHALGGGFVLMLGCDYRIAAESETARLGMTEAQAGIPFPAGPLEIMRHELSPELLRLMTLTSAVLSPRDFLQARVLDALCASEDLTTRAIAVARTLAGQPGFRAVKRQIRGPLAERLAALAATGQDAFLGEFG